MKLLIALCLLTASCQTSPAAEQQLADIKKQVEELQQEPPSEERDAQVAELQAEAGEVVRQDRRSQTMWWAELVGAMVGLGGISGLAGSRFGKSRSAAAVSDLEDRLEDMELTVEDGFETLKEVMASFETGLHSAGEPAPEEAEATS